MANYINSRLSLIENKVHKSLAELNGRVLGNEIKLESLNDFKGSKDYMKFHNKIHENKANIIKFEEHIKPLLETEKKLKSLTKEFEEYKSDGNKPVKKKKLFKPVNYSNV